MNPARQAATKIVLVRVIENGRFEDEDENEDEDEDDKICAGHENSAPHLCG